MKNHTHQLLAARALLASAAEVLDRLALKDDDTPMSPDDREIMAVTMMALGRLKPRSRADVLRFVRAVKAGDSGWLVVHSLAGGQTIEASYHAHLGADVRRAIGN